ncbi:hypothetical protein OIU84_021828 [Salix udensis]|uniref:cDENN domain-containing protein n=1 Tax=Salix udensis TaxID=889485 RepID=A0AAD6KVI0_9ROSI|nr:hypothetical protein OIU84_021828 [Salix udensis]
MDLVAPYWERPAGPTWWCHVAAGHTSVQAWLNNAKWLHPAKPENSYPHQQLQFTQVNMGNKSVLGSFCNYVTRFCHQILIYIVLSFCDPASNMGSREVSLVMEGSLIRSAIGDHWDFNKFLAFSCKPLWDVILYMVSNVPLPTPGKDMVLFAIEKCVLSVDAPPKDVLPHVEPLVQCLDVDNFLKLLTAVLHERRILLHSNKYLSEPCRDNSCLREVFTFNPSIKGHMSFDLSL